MFRAISLCAFFNAVYFRRPVHVLQKTDLENPEQNEHNRGKAREIGEYFPFYAELAFTLQIGTPFPERYDKFTVRAKAFAQQLDVRVEGAVVSVEIVAPHFRNQLFAESAMLRLRTR